MRNVYFTLMCMWIVAVLQTIAFSGQPEGLIDINKATVEELTRLPWIGTKLAEEIVKYRVDARFERIEDIMSIKGIAQPGFEKFQHMITVDDREEHDFIDQDVTE